jgi:hypothetical protein
MYQNQIEDKRVIIKEIYTQISSRIIKSNESNGNVDSIEVG